jgi:anti-sigma-K factor RskA
MRYDDRTLRQLLAGHYVLGTLRGPARRRFERLARSEAAVRAEQHFWEAQLGELALSLKPVAPPPAVWLSLQRRLQLGNTVPLRRSTPAPVRAAPVWRIYAGLAAAIVIASAVVLMKDREAMQEPKIATATAAPVFVATLKVPDSSMQWTVALSPSDGQMTASAAGDYPQLGNHSMELWWIGPSGPVPVGLLPTQGSGSMPLPKEITATGPITLAVSLEPAGGSPTGKPTGPVLTSGAAVRQA